MSHKTDKIDQIVLDLLDTEKFTPITDILQIGGLRYGTVRGSLARLVRERAISRKWNGNQRFGRYVYKREMEAQMAAQMAA